MNINQLGIPIYEDVDGFRYVWGPDLKLYLDSDVFARIWAKWKSTHDGENIAVEWLERQH